MRTRTEEINVRVYKTEKNTIRRKAKKCGMNMSEYLRTLGTGAAVREAPHRELMLAYQKLTTLHDTVRYELFMRDLDEALTEIESLLLRAYHGKEHGLSVVKNPQRHKTARSVYFVEKNGEPTRNNLMRQALDEALTMSSSWTELSAVLRKKAMCLYAIPTAGTPPSVL